MNIFSWWTKRHEQSDPIDVLRSENTALQKLNNSYSKYQIMDKRIIRELEQENHILHVNNEILLRSLVTYTDDPEQYRETLH